MIPITITPRTKRPASPSSDTETETSRSTKTPRTSNSPPTSAGSLSSTSTSSEFQDLVFEARYLITVKYARSSDCATQCHNACEIAWTIERSIEMISSAVRHELALSSHLVNSAWPNGFASLGELGLAILECEDGGVRQIIISSHGILEQIASTMIDLIDNLVWSRLSTSHTDSDDHHRDGGSGLDIDLEQCMGKLVRLSGFGEAQEELFDKPLTMLRDLMGRDVVDEADMDMRTDDAWGKMESGVAIEVDSEMEIELDGSW